MKTFVDQMEREVSIKSETPTIVSLVPSQTELLVDLGLEDQLVGVTKFCVHPEGLKQEKEIVGGTKKVHFDRIRALNPGIILCNKEENTKIMVEALEKDYPVHVSDITTLASSLALIKQYGAIFQKEKEALVIMNKIVQEQTDFKAFVQHVPYKNVLYFIWKNPWMIAGPSTFITTLLEENKFKNCYNGTERYPVVDLATSNSYQNVDLILLSSEPFPFNDAHKEELQQIFPTATILLVDGEYFSWYGSRLQYAFNYFRSLQDLIRHNLKQV
ncbi:ABC transporter substrate-binding protein [Aquimarina sp. 2-A2]|uniref:ABC transporter substrate-binding protein n=1 Tax=Aquimarina sp. 2-A2 TaxID=3382644 RepID=UPI00387F1411